MASCLTLEQHLTHDNQENIRLINKTVIEDKKENDDDEKKKEKKRSTKINEQRRILRQRNYKRQK